MAPVYEDHPFHFVTTPISKLAEAVKFITTGLNAIYLQAPHIKPQDEFSFANYVFQRYRMLRAHHSGEERLFFPAVDKLAGITGYMDVNIEQHKAFDEGLETFAKYIEALIARKASYDGNKTVSLIDKFGQTLTLHLEEEIPTILGLEKFGLEKMAPVEKVFIQEAHEIMAQLGFFDGLPYAVTNIDRAFEGGIWANHPSDPVGRIILKVVRYGTWWVHRDWWKFGACDGKGNMQPLYAVSDDD